jgi:hypothetical protein
MFEAMLDLFPDDPIAEDIVGTRADWMLSQLAKMPGQTGRDALLDAIAQHPRFAMLALQHQWSQSAWQQFRIALRALIRGTD